MRSHIAFLIIAACCLFLFPAGLRGSWLIDMERFHMSAHGRLSCIACHEKIIGEGKHPVPGDVEKSMDYFFQVEQCSGCHDNVMDEIETGSHGNGAEVRVNDLTRCIHCHDPHDAKRKPYADHPMTGERKCAECHAEKASLPQVSGDDGACLFCHRKESEDSPPYKVNMERFCFHCHGKNRSGKGCAGEDHCHVIDIAAYGLSPHRDIPCLSCHTGAARFGHKAQKTVQCEACHPPHNEKVIHDAHIIVPCQACHLGGATPVKGGAGGGIVHDKPGGTVSRVHQMTLSGKESCVKCHHKGNGLGAAAAVLPAKSLLCMPCHAATLSLNDAISIASVILFFLGMVVTGWAVFSGNAGKRIKNATLRHDNLQPAAIRTFLPFRAFKVTSVIVMDVLLQRKLFIQSKTRWLIHGLIFYSFAFRFFWGITALFLSLHAPDLGISRYMIDKNAPVNAFMFDLTGCLAMAGLFLICYVRRLKIKSPHIIPSLDYPAFTLLMGVLAVGFVLEGMRIAMTGFPPGSEFSFIGLIVADFMSGVRITECYGWVWRAHAVLAGATLIYLPFSRLKHMIMTPLNYIMSDNHHS